MRKKLGSRGNLRRVAPAQERGEGEEGSAGRKWSGINLIGGIHEPIKRRYPGNEREPLQVPGNRLSSGARRGEIRGDLTPTSPPALARAPSAEQICPG